MMQHRRLAWPLLFVLLHVGCGDVPDGIDDRQPANPAPGDQEAVQEQSSRIQNGTNDTASVLNDAVVGVPGCTGTLITSSWVLAAAHCFAGNNPVGSTIQVGVSATAPLAVRTIDQCFLHPKAMEGPGRPTPWRCGTIASNWANNPANDLALLHLTSPVPRTMAQPMRVLLHNPRPGYGAWVNQEVTLRGWGEVRTFGSAPVSSTTRQVGQNVLDTMPADLTWTADLTGGATGNALTRPGDSGGPLIWNQTSTRPTLVGVASWVSHERSVGTYNAYWANTTLATSAAWINSVMTSGTEASAQVISGATTPPSSGWLGEGADSSLGDNCPGVFNPWQTDSDGDGVGDECDVIPPSTNRLGAAHVDAAGSVLSAHNSAGAPTTVTAGLTGNYTVVMRQLGTTAGHAQVVATGSAATRCKVLSWYAQGNDERINVVCHDANGTPVNSPFVVQFNQGAAGQQGAYLWFNGSFMDPGYSWNSAGGSNGVTRTGTGQYTVSFPGMTTANLAVHVAAYGADARYCNVQSWNAASANIACYNVGGGLADSPFSFLISTGATRSDRIGGHAWINGSTSADPGYQRVTPIFSCYPSSPVSVSGYSSVSYPQTSFATPPTKAFPLTTAHGWSNSGFCKVESWSFSGATTTVQTRCFDASGNPTSSNFSQSFFAPDDQGPC